MKLVFVLFPALLIISVSGAPTEMEQTPAEDRGLSVMLKKLVKKLPHREHSSIPAEPIQPGFTTIFYSPFFPILPPHPPTEYNYGTPYGNGNAPPPYASYSGPNNYHNDDTTIITAQQQESSGGGRNGPQLGFPNLLRV